MLSSSYWSFFFLVTAQLLVSIFLEFSCVLLVFFLARVNGDRYEGEWRNGRMHGKGVKVMANGDVYNGTWENDKAEGNGVKV